MTSAGSHSEPRDRYADRSIAHRFEECAKTYASQVAVRAEEYQATYSDLDAQARDIAGALYAHGVRTGDRVGVLLHRVGLLPKAIFGILRVGGVYVPLDPEYPAERTRFVLDDCDVAVVLCDGTSRREALSTVAARAPVVAIDDLTSAEAPPGVLSKLTPETLAYILYTSGVTGMPKGVMQTHGALLRFVRNYTATLQVTPDDRMSMLYSYSFAAANMDIFGALFSGATLCFFPIKTLGLGGFVDWVAQERVTVLHTVPSVFRQLAACFRPHEICSTVRAVDLGGEPVMTADVDLFRAHFPDSAVLINHYAATELSVIAQLRISKDMTIAPGIVPVGYPPSDVEIRILDAEGNEVPRGDVGRIVVKSPGLSVGYWNRGDLTCEMFPVDPAGSGERLYLTGDCGRIGSDGWLEHLGRGDSRVKIRGQSVEIAEVENALLQMGDFKQVVVAAHSVADKSPRLMAYVVPRVGRGPSIGEVRSRLARTLPDFMLPSGLISLDRMPTTPSGKVDREALSGVGERPHAEATHAEPRDDVERQIHRLWEEVLDARPIGVHDDFFALGGDSLGAAHLFVRIERSTGRRLPLSTILKAPTIVQLADLVREETGHASVWRLVTLNERGSAPPIFFVHGVHGDVIYLRELVAALGPEQPSYAFEADGRVDGDLEVASVEELASVYVGLLRGAHPDGPYSLSGYSAGGLLAYEMARQLQAAGERVAFLGLIDTYAPVPDRCASAVGRKLNRVRGFFRLSGRERVAFASRTLARVVRRERKRFGAYDDGPLRRALRAMFDSYAPTSHFQGKVDLFRPAIPFHDWKFDRALGWDRCPSVESAFHDVPGDHRTVFEGANAKALARALRDALEVT